MPIPACGDADPVGRLLSLYDESLPEVYGYLITRCGDVTVAEDLASETFVAAVDAARRGSVGEVSPAWLVGIARHKLADHWRTREREERRLRSIHDEELGRDDDWDATLDAMDAHRVLGTLGPHHRSALSLRYLDGLSVPEVAGHLQRTVEATEALLTRARRAFRRAYGDRSKDG